MDGWYKKILENINTYILIVDKNNNIIYKNNIFCLNLFYKNIFKLNEINYNNKIYSVEYKKIENNEIQIYKEITKYKLEIDKLKKDYLTNLYNRFAIIEKIAELKNKKYSIVIGDIDYFKKINDSYGHLVGDYVLKGISELLLKNIKKYGYIGRYGGEEFIIIFPNMDSNASYEIIEKIRKLIEKTKIKVKYENCIKEFYVSMTFGITYNNENKDINNLLTEADRALYKGKKNGRNQTNIFKKNED